MTFIYFNKLDSTKTEICSLIACRKALNLEAIIATPEVLVHNNTKILNFHHITINSSINHENQESGREN